MTDWGYHIKVKVAGTEFSYYLTQLFRKLEKLEKELEKMEKESKKFK